MISAKFGSKKFQVSSKIIYTPDDLSYGEELDVEETAVKGKKPTVSFKGVKLRSLSFKVKLDSRFCTVDAEIRYWKSVMLKKKSEQFYLGAFNLGKYFLTGYDVSEIQLNKSGKFRTAILDLTFVEDGAYENRKNSGSSSSKKKKTIKIGTYVKPKKGTRWYYTAVGALKKTGLSGKAYNKKMKVSYIYQNGKAINPQGLGWMRPEDVDVV